MARSLMVRRNPPTPETEEKIRRARRCIEIDSMKDIIVAKCLRRYMTKNETIAYLYIEERREPAYAELIWEELENQNPTFFRLYNMLVVIKKQIGKYNELLVHQKNAMNQRNSNGSTAANISNQDFPSGVPSVPVPNGSTPAYVSNQNFPGEVLFVSLPNCDPAGNTRAYIGNPGNVQQYAYIMNATDASLLRETGMDVNSILNSGLFSEGMSNDTGNEDNYTRGEDGSGSGYPYQRFG
ncbi:uncharacterized protein LOC109832409 isoform X2 [Asparagus officinalis]|uniref:uncharacterized protein LOC109832409 isoform X2 n=1 Tax=Asparagus officinalis TaxID=4686 RepID=UPI00098E599D|nr:uncharacterized protein LOC109832409 isoform X2 [Asparagus officinalis]